MEKEIRKCQSESSIQMQIVDYLSHTAARFKNFMFFSIPNEGVMIGNSGNKNAKINFLKKLGLTPGIPDIEIVAEGGRVFFLEVKNSKGKVRERQKLVHAQMKNLNIPVAVVRSVEDVMDIMKMWGLC